MYCLHCGDCCRRMSPLSAPEPCPHICEAEHGGQTFTLCAVYRNRPKECANHTFPARICPIGISVLGLDDLDAIRKRIDDGWRLTGGKE
jgi:hypothetical protein